MTIMEMVKDKQVNFVCYADGNLFYKTQDGFEFPVPMEDTKGAVFRAQDKAIIFMRWIRNIKSFWKMKE